MEIKSRSIVRKEYIKKHIKIEIVAESITRRIRFCGYANSQNTARRIYREFFLHEGESISWSIDGIDYLIEAWKQYGKAYHWYAYQVLN